MIPKNQKSFRKCCHRRPVLEVGESETPRVREPSSPRRDVSFGSFPLLDETRHVSKIVPAQKPWIELRRSLSIEKPLLRLVSQRKCNQPSLFSSQTDEPDSKTRLFRMSRDLYPSSSRQGNNYQSSIIDKPLIAFADRTRAPEHLPRRTKGRLSANWFFGASYPVFA